MFCERCGNTLDDSDIFCSKCGARLGITTEEYYADSFSTAKQANTAKAAAPGKKKAFLMVSSIFMILFGAVGLLICTRLSYVFIRDSGFNPLNFLNKMGTLEWERDLTGNVIRFISLIISVVLSAYSIAAGYRGCKQEDLKKCDFTANALLGISAVNLLVILVFNFYSGDANFRYGIFELPGLVFRYIPLILFPLMYKFAAVKAVKENN